MTIPSTIRKTKLGDLELRLVEKDKRFIGLIISGSKVDSSIEGPSADDVWRRLHDEAGKANPNYFGFDGARSRFLHFFPNGFHSADYEHAERNYKIGAKTALDHAVPVEKAANGTGYSEAVLSSYNETNLLAPFEKMRVRDALRSPVADNFIQAAARFALGDGKSALKAMESALKPYDAAKWTTVTYLPFLWRPEQHMFLKPEVTKDFAERVGHRFASDYEPRLDIAVYEGLLDLSAKTEAELSDLKPRDRVDVQSFIWVIGNYKQEDAETASK
jgi:hypothetical protein